MRAESECKDEQPGQFLAQSIHCAYRRRFDTLGINSTSRACDSGESSVCVSESHKKSEIFVVNLGRV